MMIKIKERMLEYFEKYSEFIEHASESGALMRLSAFLVEKILGPECKNDPVNVYEMADHIGINTKGIDEYFEGCQKTFLIE